MPVTVWSPSRVPIPPPQPWPFVVDSFYVQPLQPPRRIAGGRLTCPVTARRSVSGARGILPPGSLVCKMRRAQVGRGAFPPSERLDVLALATSPPADSHCPATRWRLAEMTAVLRDHARTQAMSRSTLWRTRAAAALKPHRSVSWRQSHAPAVAAKARDLCALYGHALRFSPQGRLVLGGDAKTGRQMLQRTYSTQPAQPGKPEQREHEYRRPGGRGLMASWVVPTGQGRWHLGPTRPSEAVAAPLANVVRQRPARPRYAWVVANLTTHWSLEVCRLVAAGCALPVLPKPLRRGAQRRACLSDPTHQPVVHCTPQHGSGLNQVALWFGVLARRFLQRGAFCSVDDFAARLRDDLDVYNTHYAHPYRWT